MSAGVVVGYDGSDFAKAALRAALDVGKAYSEPVTVVFGYELNQAAGEIQDYAAALRELARQRLEEARQFAAGHDSGVEIQTVIVQEAPAKALVQLADERDARLIVIGSRGESPIRGALLGSTAHKLLHVSDRPVLVVPSHTA